MYERVLIPTDGSPAMGSIVEQGLGQAARSDATVHAVYVVDVRSYMMLPEETAGEVDRLLGEEGGRALDGVRELAEERDLEFVGEVVRGVPHAAILEYVDDHDVDLVVMGTHGRSGEEQRVVGSVAEEVIRNAEVPVLVVRMSEVERRAVADEVPEAQQRYVR